MFSLFSLIFSCSFPIISHHFCHLCNFIRAPGLAAWRWPATSVSIDLCMTPESIMSYHSTPPSAPSTLLFFIFFICAAFPVVSLISLVFTSLFVLPSLHVMHKQVCNVKLTEAWLCFIDTSSTGKQR